MYYYHHWSNSPLHWLFNNLINPDPLAGQVSACIALDHNPLLKPYQTDGYAWSRSEHYGIRLQKPKVHVMPSQGIDRENNKAARNWAATLHRNPVTLNKQSAVSPTKIGQCVSNPFKRWIAQSLVTEGFEQITKTKGEYMKAANLANSSASNKRRALDYYPTPPDVTHALMRFLELPPCTIWEPACGNGAMSDVLAQYRHVVISSDLRNTGYGDGGVDFLSAKRQCDAVITNPPFNMSEEFIRHALRQAGTVAMILKSQYWHAKKRAALFGEFPPAYVLPLTWRPDFMGGERGGAPTMEVHWTVWLAGDTDTKYRLLGRDV